MIRKYLKYLIIHKWYVLIECFKMGLYWRGIVHDMSKFLPSEFLPYMRYFYGDYKSIQGYHGDMRSKILDTGMYSEKIQEDFDKAWLYHQRKNRHHYQYWLLKEDGGKRKVIEMPDKYRKEMIADWIGAGKAQGKLSPKEDPLLEVRKWYIMNKDNIILHPETQYKVEQYLGLLNDSCA